MSINKADVHFKKAMLPSALLGLSIHFALLFLFLFLEVIEMVYFNFLSISIFAIAYIVMKVKKSYYSVFLAISSVEVVVHAIFATYYAGLDSGFFFFIWVIPPIMIISQRIQLMGVLVIFGTTSLVHLLLQYSGSFDHPPYLLDPHLLKITYLISINSVFLTSIVVIFYFRKLSLTKDDQMRAEIIEKEKMNEELNGFAERIAHDIKSPLNNITQLSQIIVKERGEAEPDVKIQLIQKSADRLKGLVDSLLKFSKSGQIVGGSEKIDLKLFFAGVNDLFGNKSDVELTFNTKLEVINTNKVLLDTTVRNLIDNGIKYNDKQIAQISVSIEQNNGEYLLRVKDNGIGIEKEQISKIFDLYHFNNLDRSGKEGTGIGLSMTKKAIVAFGGTIECYSTAHLETTFEVRLPISY